MRYTEKEYDGDARNLKDWIQNSVGLFVVAPLRLINEISSKIVYLKRSLIIKILNLAVIINLVSLVLNGVISTWLGNFNIWLGKVPFVLQIASFIILLTINIWYRCYDFMIYRQLSALLPIVTHNSIREESFTEEKSDGVVDTENNKSDNIGEVSHLDKFNGDKKSDLSDFDASLMQELADLDLSHFDDITASAEPNSTKSAIPNELSGGTGIIDTSDIFSENPARDTIKEVDADLVDTSVDTVTFDDNDELLALLNNDLIDDDNVILYQHNADIQLEPMEAILDEMLEKDMEEAVKPPSKYISEEDLNRFLGDLGADSFGNIDLFSDWDSLNNLNLTG